MAKAASTWPCSRMSWYAVRWQAAATGPVIDEARTVDLRVGEDEELIIDWTSVLLPLADLTLDRTPYTTWGGYSGLTFRAGRELHYGEYLLPTNEKKHPLIGENHPWVALQARVDGGWEEFVTVAMMDHPSNVRSPSPWYAKADPHYVFFNAAFLFHEAMTVPKGVPLTFRYRVIIRDGLATADVLSALADDYRDA